MVKYDLNNAFIGSIQLPKYNQKSKSFGSSYEKGLNLVVAWRHGASKVSTEVAASDALKFFRFIWRLRYRKADGGRSSIDLGFWPAMGQDAAIEAARKVKLGVIQGRDLVAEKQVEQEQIIPKKLVNDNTSIAGLLNAFLKWRKDSFPDKQSTNSYYEKQIINHLLPKWGLFSIDAITQWTWQEYIREIKQKFSDNVARHVHSTMRVAFSFAVDSNAYPQITINPLLGLKVAKELKKTAVRERFFNHTELHHWMNELYERDEPVTQVNILMLQLYQGLRIAEILNIKISDLKTLSKSEIKVIVKGDKAGYTMLSTQAIELIKSQMRYLIESGIKSGWLFPCENNPTLNYTTTQAGDFVKNVRRHWLQFSTHDLRRTCRTWLGEFGCPKEMRDRICNHATPTGKDASYDHFKQKDAQLRWMQLWADKLDENAFKMDADTSIDEESANELDDLMNQLL